MFLGTSYGPAPSDFMMSVVKFRKSKRELLRNNQEAKNRLLQEPNTLLTVFQAIISKSRKAQWQVFFSSTSEFSTSYQRLCRCSFCDIPPVRLATAILRPVKSLDDASSEQSPFHSESATSWHCRNFMIWKPDGFYGIISWRTNYQQRRLIHRMQGNLDQSFIFSLQQDSDNRFCRASWEDMASL